jgi:hypothetical protein
VSSANIVAMISANLTSQKAEALLTNITHDRAGKRIGDNVTIYPLNLCLLHLPRDVLSAMPQTVQNSDTGGTQATST